MDFDDVHQRGTAWLIARCAEQNRLFYQRQAHEERFCLELFRRAIVKREDAAWTAIVTQYRPQVERWILRMGSVDEPTLDELAADAIMRFWRAYTPNDLLRARSLSDVLGYWRDCARSAMLDRQRRQRREALPLDDLDGFSLTSEPTDRWENRLAHREMQLEVWRLVLEHCQDEGDVLLTRRVFVEGCKPREVFAQMPRLFARQEDVY